MTSMIDSLLENQKELHKEAKEWEKKKKVAVTLLCCETPKRYIYVYIATVEWVEAHWDNFGVPLVLFSFCLVT